MHWLGGILALGAIALTVWLDAVIWIDLRKELNKNGAAKSRDNQ